MRVYSNEHFRLKRLANLAAGAKVVADVGWAQSPNPYIRAETVIGIDVNPEARPENYSRVFVGELADFYASADFELIDALIAGEILEHVLDPLDFLKCCFNSISPGGKIVLSTPNPNSPIERLLTLSLSRRYFYTSEHIYIFPQRWLIRILEISGFADIKLFSGGFPVPGLGLIPFPRAYCYQTIAVGIRPHES